MASSFLALGDPCLVCPGGRTVKLIDPIMNCFYCTSPGSNGFICHTGEELETALAAIKAASKPVNVFHTDPYTWTVDTPSTLDETRFPHDCPRCGAKCYIGLSTEHRDREQDEVCEGRASLRNPSRTRTL